MKTKNNEMKIPFQFKGGFKKCFHHMGIECIETLYQIHSTPCPLFLKKDEYLDRRYWALLTLNNIFDAWMLLANKKTNDKNKIEKLKWLWTTWEDYKNNFFKKNAHKDTQEIIKKVREYLYGN